MHCAFRMLFQLFPTFRKLSLLAGCLLLILMMVVGQTRGQEETTTLSPEQRNEICAMAETEAGVGRSIKRRTVSASTRDNIILKEINKLRRDFANAVIKDKDGNDLPKCSNMNQIYWDEELAQLAQDEVDKCFGSTRLFEDGKKKGATRVYQRPEPPTKDGQKLGQTFELIASKDGNYYPDDTSFQRQFLKKTRVNKDDYSILFYGQRVLTADLVKSYSPVPENSKAPDFFQVVWATNQYIGCGFLEYYSDASYLSREHYFSLPLCYFSPGGAIPGEPVCEEGEPCSGCPAGVPCVDSLCQLLPPTTTTSTEPTTTTTTTEETTTTTTTEETTTTTTTTTEDTAAATTEEAGATDLASSLFAIDCDNPRKNGILGVILCPVLQITTLVVTVVRNLVKSIIAEVKDLLNAVIKAANDLVSALSLD